MYRIIRHLLLLGATMLLFACDQNGRPIEEIGLDKLAKGVSSESDVRMIMGQPDSVREDADGLRLLEYPKGPEGVRTWLFTIDQFGKLKDYRQLLTEENFARVQPGMRREEVRHMLGKPRSVVPFKRKNEEVWDWRYLDGTRTKDFNVHFDLGTGKVTQTSVSEDHFPG